MYQLQTTRDKIFKDHHFYSSKPDAHHVRYHQYQSKLGQKEHNTFRKKKVPTFINHSYSSNLNQLTRGHGRRDRPYKQTYQKKKRNQLYSDFKTDPISMIYQPSPKMTKVRPQFQSIFASSIEAERRYELPAARIISPTYKKYWAQTGLSYSVQPKIRIRECLNSSLMKSSIEYTNANHSMERLTGKIGSLYNL